MSESPILAIDAGTTTLRALVVDASQRVLGRASVRANVAHPAPGRVEQDVEQIWRAVRDVVGEALRSAAVDVRSLAALGISAQRGNVVVWERDTGRPAAPLVSWQDVRGTARAAELVAAGFMVSHQMACTKLESVLSDVDRGRQRLNSGALLWGNVDTYLAWRLSEGEIYAIDHGQACATGYYDYFAGTWNRALIAAQGLDAARFPSLADTAAVHGAAAPSFGARTPIAALVADQQSAAIAQGCLTPGLGKVTYGTSATLDVNTGAEMKLGAGAYPMVLWTRRGTRTFCIEGMVNTAGAMIDWTIGGLGLADSPEALSRLAGSVCDTNGAYVLPALQGLGAPHGDAHRRATIGGLTRATTRAHVARATLEGIAFRVREVYEAVRALGVPLTGPLRADGGASRSDVLMQIQADLIGVPIERAEVAEASALGAAACAAIALGAPDDVATARRVDRAFLPTLSDDERDARYAQWRVDCGLAS